MRDWQRRVTAEGRPKDMNHGGFTPLLFAAREGYVDAARALLKSGADIDLPDPDGTTPLVLALTNGQWDMAKALIDSGANVNDWDFWGQSPLYMAVDMNILPAGFRVELPRMDEATGLDIIRLLLAKGANPDVQLKLRPPYRNAVQDRGADGTLIAGATPLMRAATGGDIAALKLLLAAGAKVDLPNEEGATPLMAAVSAAGTRGRNKTEEQALEAVKLLRAAGADVNTRDVARHDGRAQRCVPRLECDAEGAGCATAPISTRANPTSSRRWTTRWAAAASASCRTSPRCARKPRHCCGNWAPRKKTPICRRGPASEPLD